LDIRVSELIFAAYTLPPSVFMDGKLGSGKERAAYAHY